MKRPDLDRLTNEATYLASSLAVKIEKMLANVTAKGIIESVRHVSSSTYSTSNQFRNAIDEIQKQISHESHKLTMCSSELTLSGHERIQSPSRRTNGRTYFKSPRRSGRISKRSADRNKELG
eukprot:TRINITY_DN4244_c0_g4_i1.p1 TRINITY_DN4244_c0_g4~~TRINITY_DN4244_c0_g4_i1.p1  ORF type:complete len:122 (+),score=16.93 TRINITY_DN4244_c0_g4_i1:364-729(+)